jgi:SRSO17 transposase
MPKRAAAAGVPRGTVLGDSAYGKSSPLRRACRDLEFPYAVGVMPTDRVGWLDRRGRRIDDAPVAIEDSAVGLGRGAFRKTTWRQGSKVPLSSYFALERVHMVQGDGIDEGEPEHVWLLMEWERGASAPSKYHVLWLPHPSARRLTRKKAARIVKQRWRTERAYEDLKGELGLAHSRPGLPKPAHYLALMPAQPQQPHPGDTVVLPLPRMLIIPGADRFPRMTGSEK